MASPSETIGDQSDGQTSIESFRQADAPDTKSAWQHVKDFSSYFGERVMSGQVRDDMFSGMLGLADGMSLGFLPLIREHYDINLSIAEGNASYNIGDMTSFAMISGSAIKLISSGAKQMKRSWSWRTNSRTSRQTRTRMRNSGAEQIGVGAAIIISEEAISALNGAIE